MKTIENKVIAHYEDIWKSHGRILQFTQGRINELPNNFRVIEFAPSSERNMWSYGTCGLSNVSSLNPIELHIFSGKQDRSIVELLSVVAHYHINSNFLGLHHTVNFGRPWQENSICENGFISLPYLDGPNLENLLLPEFDNKIIKFYWLIPVTRKEVDFAIRNGVEALENEFEDKQVNYIDIHRTSVI